MKEIFNEINISKLYSAELTKIEKFYYDRLKSLVCFFLTVLIHNKEKLCKVQNTICSSFKMLMASS